MALTAYAPLETVYKFHQTAERWILRRYPVAMEAVTGAERRRSALWSESVIDVFPDRSGKRSTQDDTGQRNPDRRMVYTTTRLLITDTSTGQATDVLFDPRGNAWQATSSGDWDEARGYAVGLTRSGRRGEGEWRQ